MKNLAPLLPLLLLSMIIGKWIPFSQHHLRQNDQWLVHRFSSPIKLNNVKDYYISRNALNEDKLDLSKWHGNQGVISIDKIKLPISLSLFKEDNAELGIFLAPTTSIDSFKGVLIAQDKTFVVEGEDQFKFRTKLLFTLTKIRSEKEIKK